TDGLTASLGNSSINSGEAYEDTYNSIENLIGSNFGDNLNGTAGGAANIISGLAGNDIIKGYSGIDTLDGGNGDDILIGGLDGDELIGGAGADTASYEGATSGLVANLANPSNNTGDAAGDTYNAIENLIGTVFADQLYGNNADNILNGGDGDDILIGGLDGDELVGGAGADTASYDGATEGLVASLGNSSINTGEAEGDTYNTVENLTGSNFSDTLNGSNTVNNVIRGGGGDDLIKGYTGNDTLEGGAGADAFIFNTALNETTNVDTILDFSSADDTIQLDDAFFSAITGTGTMLSGYFKNLDVAAIDANDRILYEKSTGDLFYDADGSGSGARIKFAEVSINTNLTYQDFFIY
ncbi:calcium-binding protein, partial [Rhizobium sp. Leaf386]|uniref:calcium-binding protein n=1 Tax=Rhizobium sp. Leaf386 TaxID=1736359 RepID=UPI0007150472